MRLALGAPFTLMQHVVVHVIDPGRRVIGLGPLLWILQVAHQSPGLLWVGTLSSRLSSFGEGGQCGGCYGRMEVDVDRR